MWGRAEKTHGGRGRFRRIDRESDAFAATLAGLLGSRVRPQRMREVAEFSYVCLEGDPSEPWEGAFRLRLQFDDGNIGTEMQVDLLASDLGLEIVGETPHDRRGLVRAIASDG